MLIKKIIVDMKIYIAIGLLFFLINNYEEIVNKENGLFYKLWSLLIVTLLFPIPLIVMIMESHPKTEYLLDRLVENLEDFFERISLN